MNGHSTHTNRSTPKAEASHARSSDDERLTPLREMQLVEAYRGGDSGAIAELLASYQRRIYAVCYRMLRDVDEAADLAQDAMVKVLDGLLSFDGRSKLSTWIIRVTMNCCLSHLRKQKLRKHGRLDDLTADPADVGAGGASAGSPGIAGSKGGLLAALTEKRELSGPQSVEQGELREILLQALDSLEPDVRAMIVLRDVQDLDYQQIGTVLGVPVGTVKSRLFRARLALRTAAEARMSGETTAGDPKQE